MPAEEVQYVSRGSALKRRKHPCEVFVCVCGGGGDAIVRCVGTVLWWGWWGWHCCKEFQKGYEQETRDSATRHGINLVQVHLWGMEQGGAALSLCSARHKTLVESMQFHRVKLELWTPA